MIWPWYPNISDENEYAASLTTHAPVVTRVEHTEAPTEEPVTQFCLANITPQVSTSNELSSVVSSTASGGARNGYLVELFHPFTSASWASAVFNLDQRFQSLSGVVAVPKTSAAPFSVAIYVYGDSKLLDVVTIDQLTTAIPFSVDLNAISTLEILVHDLARSPKNTSTSVALNDMYLDV